MHEAPKKMIIKLQEATLRMLIFLGDELSCMRSGRSSDCTFKPHEARAPAGSEPRYSKLWHVKASLAESKSSGT